MMKGLFFVAFALLSWEATSQGCDGSCQNNSYSCPVAYKSGLCPGPTNIECCTEQTPSCGGQCQDKSLSCNGTYKSGDCPGNSNVLCCVGIAPFANRYWNCANPSCSSTVAAGGSQPNYECAEFVARSLATAGWMPNLGSLAAQSSYGSYVYGGKTYDLLWVSDKQGGPLGLREYLIAVGWTMPSISAANIKDGTAVFCEGSGGSYGHVAIGVGANTCDAHNNARYKVNPCNTYYTIDELREPPAKSPAEWHFEADAGPLPEHLRKERTYATPQKGVY